MRNEYNYKIIYWKQGHFGIFTITSEEGNVNETLLEEIRSVIPSAEIVGIISDAIHNFRAKKLLDEISGLDDRINGAIDTLREVPEK